MEYTSEQKELIEEAWKELHENDVAPEPKEQEVTTVKGYDEEHAKPHEDLEHRILGLALVIEVMVGEMAGVNDDLAKISTFINEGLLGGATKLAKEGARRIGIGEVMTKYHPALGPYED